MSHHDDLSGAVVSSRYRLDALLRGNTADSRVYTATDLQSAASVVVRLVSVSGEEMESWKSHILSVAGVSHPVLVVPLDWGEATIQDSRFAFVVTERLVGTSLRELLDRGRRLSPSQTVVLAIDLCRALHHLHQQGIVHGDVRPANVFVSSDARGRLAGLGVKRVQPGAAGMSSEQVRYAAPELASDDAVTPAADVYALALTVLETITGDVPFVSDSSAVTLASRAGRLVPVPAGIGPVAVPLEKAARPVPEDRSTALEFGQALAQVAGKLPAPLAVESLAGESFRDTITRSLETVIVNTPKTTADENTQVVPTPPRNIDVVLPPPAEERRRYRWLWSIAIAVALVVSGVLTWQTLNVDSYTVPSLAGVAEGEARNSIALFGWNVIIRAERSDDVAVGGVIRSIPPAGSVLREGDDFVLVISEGATLAVIPDVTGLSREDAVAALSAQGLVITETLRDDDTIPEGRVVSWIVTEQPNLTAGSEVLRGTQVDIVVSGGPVLRSVPNLIGRSEDDAKAQLDSVQLTGQRNDDVYSSEIAPGLVASQEPRSGEQLSRGDIVAYSLSKGIESVELPSVVGLSLNDAQRILGDVGIGVATVSGRATGRVRSVTQDDKTLVAGDRVAKGSAVNLIFP